MEESEDCSALPPDLTIQFVLEQVIMSILLLFNNNIAFVIIVNFYSPLLAYEFEIWRFWVRNWQY